MELTGYDMLKQNRINHFIEECFLSCKRTVSFWCSSFLNNDDGLLYLSGFFSLSSESNGLIFVLHENKSQSQSFFIVKVMYFLYLIFEVFISFLLVLCVCVGVYIANNCANEKSINKCHIYCYCFYLVLNDKHWRKYSC